MISSAPVKLVAASTSGTRCPQRVGQQVVAWLRDIRLRRLFWHRLRRSRSTYAAFLVGCDFFARDDLPLVFPFAPLCSRLFCKTDTRSITFVGFGAFLGFSSISLPPASTFSSITSISASR